ncbi:MAG: DoxX family protein [Polyangiaceae bacterium]
MSTTQPESLFVDPRSAARVEEPTVADAGAATAHAAGAARADAPSRAALWTGRVLSGVAVLFLAFDGGFKLFAPPAAIEGTKVLGWAPNTIVPLGILQIALLAIHLVPRTAVLGAVLWTGYLGGAVATHVRLGNPLFSHILFPVYVAAFLWVGLALRDRRARALLGPR